MYQDFIVFCLYKHRYTMYMYSNVLFSVNHVRLSSNLISILEPHLKELVKQHGEISDRLSVTEVMWYKLIISIILL